MYAITKWDSVGDIEVYLADVGDEAFEPDSESSIKIALSTILDGAIEWQRGNYHAEKKDLAILDVVATLEHHIAKLKLMAIDEKEVRIGKMEKPIKKEAL